MSSSLPAAVRESGPPRLILPGAFGRVGRTARREQVVDEYERGLRPAPAGFRREGVQSFQTTGVIKQEPYTFQTDFCTFTPFLEPIQAISSSPNGLSTATAGSSRTCPSALPATLSPSTALSSALTLSLRSPSRPYRADDYRWGGWLQRASHRQKGVSRVVWQPAVQRDQTLSSPQQIFWTLQLFTKGTNISYFQCCLSITSISTLGQLTLAERRASFLLAVRKPALLHTRCPVCSRDLTL